MEEIYLSSKNLASGNIMSEPGYVRHSGQQNVLKYNKNTNTVMTYTSSFHHIGQHDHH